MGAELLAAYRAEGCTVALQAECQSRVALEECKAASVERMASRVVAEYRAEFLARRCGAACMEHTAQAVWADLR